MIGVVAIALAVIGSQLIETSDSTEAVDSPDISTGVSNQGLKELQQPGGSSSRTGVSNSVGFVVRDSDGKIIDSGFVSGD